MQKKRSAAISVLFNLVNPGLGFLYVGKLAYAIVYPAVLILLIGVSSWTTILFKPLGLSVTVLFLFVLWLTGLILAAVMAHRAGLMSLSNYQRWYVYIGFFIVTTLISSTLMENRSTLFGYEPFRFPSGSMENTLLAGDFIISNTWKYKTKKPGRGEVVVFLYPEDPSIKYLKRVIGLPNDVIKLSDGKVYVNGLEVDEPYVDESNNQRLSQQKSLQYQVPADAYFVLGDNRDNSRDSRYWGFVPEANLYGSVELIWMSYTSITGFRTERLGMLVK